MILIDWNGVELLARKNFESIMVICPPLVGRFHGRIIVKSPTAISSTLIIVELHWHHNHLEHQKLPHQRSTLGLLGDPLRNGISNHQTGKHDIYKLESFLSFVLQEIIIKINKVNIFKLFFVVNIELLHA